MSITLRSSTISQPAQAWLEADRPCRVLHVFDQACNLINDRDQLLSIVGPLLGVGPFSVALSQPTPPGFTRGINLTTPVGVMGDQLAIGHLRVEAKSAAQWDPRPDWHELRRGRERLFGSLERLIALGAWYAPEGSFFDLILEDGRREKDGEALFRDFVLRRAAVTADLLGKGVVRVDLDQVRVAALDLSGLGSGLTPAGDDFLSGAMIASRIILRSDEHAQICSTISQASHGRTNALSSAYIGAAGRGEIHSDWHLLFQSLLQVRSAELGELVQRICAWGHSSGADTLGGFLCVFLTARKLGKG